MSTFSPPRGATPSAGPPAGAQLSGSAPLGARSVGGNPIEDAAWQTRYSKKKTEALALRRQQSEERNQATQRDLQQALAGARVVGDAIPETLTVKPSVFREVPQEQLEDFERQQRRSVGPITRFVTGAASTIAHSGRGVSRAFGFNELSEQFEEVSSRESNRALGASGLLGQVTGGLAPFVAAAAGGPGTATAGLSALFIDAFGNAKADMDDFEREHDIAIPESTRTAVSVGAGAINVVAGLLGKGITTRATGKMVQEVGTSLIAGNTKRAAVQLTKALGISAAEAGAVNAGLQAAQNAVVQMGYDEDRSLLEGVPESAALGLGLGIIGPGLGVRGALKGASAIEGVKRSLVDSNLVRPSEVKMAGDDVRVLMDVAMRRRAGEEVRLDSRDGKLEVTSKPDLVTWDEQRALDFNEALIDDVRKQRAAGKPVDVFVEPARGVVSPEELSSVRTRLEELNARLKPEEAEFKDGVPLTKRALLKGDVEYLLGNLSDRTSVNQGKLLVETANRRKLVESTEGFRPTDDLIGPRERVITPLDVNPRDRLKLRMERASEKGYFRDPGKLTPNLKLREVIREDQVRTLRALFELRRGTKLSPGERSATVALLENEYIDRMDRRLKRRSDTPKGAKIQALREVKNLKDLSEGDKALAVAQVSKLVDDVSKTSKTISQAETLARVIEEASDPANVVHPRVLETLETLHRRITTDERTMSWSERSRRGIRQSDRLLAVRPVLNDKSRALVGKVLESLPPEQRAALRSQLTAAKDNAELRAVIQRTRDAQERVVRGDLGRRGRDLLDKLNTNPRRQEGVEFLERVLGRASTTVRSVGRDLPDREASHKAVSRYLKTNNLQVPDNPTRAFWHGIFVATSERIAESIGFRAAGGSLEETIATARRVIDSSREVEGVYGGMSELEIAEFSKLTELLERSRTELRKTVVRSGVSEITTSRRSWFEDFVGVERADITPQEQARLKLAKKPAEWGKQSEAHGYFSRRFDTLVETGAISQEGATLLRYVLSEFSPSVLGRISSIRETGHIPIPGKAESAYGEYNWQTRGLRVLRGLHKRGVSEAQVFLHELFHGVYFNFLSSEQVRAVDDAWGRLKGEASTRVKGESKAHDIVRNVADKEGDFSYFAEDPAEFFAETAANYVLETRTPPPVLRRIISQVIKPIFDYLLSLSKFKITEKLLPEEYKTVIEQGIRGERTGTGETLAELLGAETDTTLYSKPLVKRDAKTGSSQVDPAVLEERLGGLPLDQARDVINELGRIVRKGQVERGVYDKYLKYRGSEDARQVLETLGKKAPQGDVRKKFEVPISLAKTVFDPVMVDSMLLQWAGGDSNNPLVRILHSDLEQPYSRAQTAMADGRKALAESSKKHLGIDASTTKGEFKFLTYLRQKLPNGIQRDEAMWAYALSTDEGRSEVLEKVGIEARSQKFEVQESIGYLSERDKAFVDSVKGHFENNQSVEKAFDVYSLLNGYVPERYRKWFSSRREVERQRLPKSLGEFELEVTKAIDPLKERTLRSNAPFKVDGGFAAEFYNVVDRLAIYGEMGKELYRAEKLLVNPEIKREIVSRFGENRYKYLSRYLQNIQGEIGASADAFDIAVRYGTRASNISKLATNVTSGIKQTLSILTAMGDDVLDNSALAQAVVEGSFASKGVGKRMRENSGFTYMRLSPGRFAEQLLVLGHRTLSPRLSLLQDRALFLQKFFDDHSLRVLYRAAEIMAEKKGLKGEQAKEFATSTFERALQRNQTSSSAMYVSDLELKASQQPLLLGALSFRRELNRVYNVSRRHVVTAVQQPTPGNISKAVNAVLFAGLANTGANVAVNNARRLAFGLGAYSAGEWLTESIKSLAGQLYLVGDSASVLTDILSEKGVRPEEQVGVLGRVLVDGYKAGDALYKAIKAGGSPDEADRYIQSGADRGRSKIEKELEKALDRGLSATSAVLGLPLWMMYYQGKGLYNWKREDWRLMVQLEREKAQLERRPEENSLRLQEIEALRERINKIHRYREQGLLERKEAQRQIISELRFDRGS